MIGRRRGLRGPATKGSALLLVPAGFLVLLVLASIAVDLSLLQLRQRAVSALVADLANDLATAALDVDELRATGRYRIDEGRARALAEELLADAEGVGRIVSATVAVPDDDTVRVEVVAEVDYLFAAVVPGARRSAEVRAAAVAVAVDPDAGGGAGAPSTG